MSQSPTRTLRLTGQGRLDDPSLLAVPGLDRVLGLLNADGEEARIVGGAVRNALLGRPVADIDIATTAEPAMVMARAKAEKVRAIPTGLAHGTVTLVVAGTPFEVTTLRRDVATDGRHATVQFSRDFAEDADRRDFTINALSLGPDGVVHDTVGGVADLMAGRVRFIGDADRRIREDYLRILRFFRFHAAYGLGTLDIPGSVAARRHRDALRTLSRERIRAELLKLLAADDVALVISAMDAMGIMSRVLGGPADALRLTIAAGIEAGRGNPPDALLRLAALAVRDAGDAVRLGEALRLSGAESRRIADAEAARRRLDLAHPPDRAGCLALLYTCGATAARDGALLAATDAGGGPAWLAALDTLARETPPELPVGGDAVMARGVAGGRRVGAVLKRLQADWIRAGFPRDPATLATLLDAAVAAEAGTTPAAD